MTCLAYLAEPTRGGRTVFPKLGVGFDPRVGGEFLLLFPYGRLVMTSRVFWSQTRCCGGISTRAGWKIPRLYTRASPWKWARSSR